MKAEATATTTPSACAWCGAQHNPDEGHTAYALRVKAVLRRAAEAEARVEKLKERLRDGRVIGLEKRVAELEVELVQTRQTLREEHMATLTAEITKIERKSAVHLAEAKQELDDAKLRFAELSTRIRDLITSA